MKNKNKFIDFYKRKHKHHQFFFLEEIPKECWEDFRKLCEKDDPRLGYYIYHSHVVKDGKLQFDGMKVAYYIRNPFHKWRHKKVNI